MAKRKTHKTKSCKMIRTKKGTRCKCGGKFAKKARCKK